MKPTNLTESFHEDCKEKYKSEKFKLTTYRTRIWLKKSKNPFLYYNLMEDVICFLLEVRRQDKKNDFGIMPRHFSMVLRSEFLNKPVEVKFSDSN